MHESATTTAGTSRPASGPQVLRDDRWDRELVAHVHPQAWASPEPAARYNLVVLGAGTAGLVTAAGAAGLGARVALVERDLMGGDCLNVGCVPSKCVIRSSRVAGDLAIASELGFRVPPGAEPDFRAVMERMRRLRAGIARHDSARRFQEELGVDVFLGSARFTGPDAVAVADRTLRFKRAVIATGARAVHPSIPGLAEAGFLTNETVFTLTERPGRLAVIGGGPIGCELAQAFRRLGSEVVVLDAAAQLLPREDAGAAAIVEAAFRREAIELVLEARIESVRRDGERKLLAVASPAGRQEIAVDEILVGAGRAPNVEGLGLEAVGVELDRGGGVRVNDRLQTTNPRIYAAGDVALATKFTHAADAAARIVIQNALFRGRRKVTDLVIPWCTYTDPEIAHVGISQSDARARGIAIDTFRVEMSAVDRAIADGETEGFVEIHVEQGGDRILGATIVARHAGEMLGEITLAMTAGIGLGKLASVIHSYPTQAEAIRKAADAYRRTLLTPFVKRLFSAWLRWDRR